MQVDTIYCISIVSIEANKQNESIQNQRPYCNAEGRQEGGAHDCRDEQKGKKEMACECSFIFPSGQKPEAEECRVLWAV